MNDEWNHKVDKWKNILLHMKKSQIVLILFAGILLVIAAFPKKSETGENVQDETSKYTDDSSGITYETYMENRVEQVLAKVEGVGKTEVVLTFRTNGEKVVEKDLDSNQESVTEEDSTGGIRTSKNTVTQKKSIYEQQKDGTQSPYISKELMPEIEGVLVVAEGGDDPVIVKNITEAVQALFGVEAHKIKIMKRKDT